MIIVHDGNLDLRHVIYEHPETYHEVLEAEGAIWIKVHGSISLDHIRLSRHPETDEIQLHRQAPGEDLTLVPLVAVTQNSVDWFRASASAEKIALDGVVTIAPIPTMTNIQVNGDAIGVMDESNVLEFKGDNAGLYHIKLSKDGYQTKEFQIEVIL